MVQRMVTACNIVKVRPRTQNTLRYKYETAAVLNVPVWVCPEPVLANVHVLVSLAYYAS